MLEHVLLAVRECGLAGRDLGANAAVKGGVPGADPLVQRPVRLDGRCSLSGEGGMGSSIN